MGLSQKPQISNDFSPLPLTFVMLPFSAFELVSLEFSDQVVPLS